MENSNADMTAIKSPALTWEFRNLADKEQGYSHSEILLLLHQYHIQRKFIEQRISEQERRIQELEKLALIDPLTGIMNRRGFDLFFSQELARTRRHNTLGSVLILFDLDRFKEVNDTYGHQAGDACLKEVAQYLRNKIRNVDAVARMGGDEFAVLLSHTDLEKSSNCINEIRCALEDLRTIWQGRELRISASIGISHITAMSTYETEYHDADKHLYKNKRQKKAIYISDSSISGPKFTVEQD